MQYTHENFETLLFKQIGYICLEENKFLFLYKTIR